MKEQPVNKVYVFLLSFTDKALFTSNISFKKGQLQFSIMSLNNEQRIGDDPFCRYSACHRWHNAKQ